jgi:hypothetical protein
MSFRRAVALIVSTAVLAATTACSSPTAPTKKSCDQNGTTWTMC